MFIRARGVFFFLCVFCNRKKRGKKKMNFFSEMLKKCTDKLKELYFVYVLNTLDATRHLSGVRTYSPHTPRAT